MAVITKVIDFFCPIADFLYVIMVLATLNIILGAIADNDWQFKKAFKAFTYLIGYMVLLTLSLGVGKLMDQPDKSIYAFTSWVTWVMTYFYVVNILRNWNLKQPDNRVISFLYWIASVKFVDNIKFLGEYLKQEKK